MGACGLKSDAFARKASSTCDAICISLLAFQSLYNWIVGRVWLYNLTPDFEASSRSIPEVLDTGGSILEARQAHYTCVPATKGAGRVAPSMTDIPMLSKSMIRRMELATDLTQERQAPRLITTIVSILNIGSLLDLGNSFSHALSMRDFLQQELPVARGSARNIKHGLPSRRRARELCDLWEL